MQRENLVIKFDHFNSYVQNLFNNEQTSLPEKIKEIAHFYIEMMIKYPEAVPYILSRTDSDDIVSKMKEINDLNNSVIARQIKEITFKNGNHIVPQHFVMNIISMCMFPFLAGNMIKKHGRLDEETYNAMMEERKTLIPVWAMAMINA